MSSTFSTEGTDSAMIETVIVPRAADGCAGARHLTRQQTRRENARGADPAYEGVTFDAGRRWVSR
jgi:hypothetical protein